jgi:hypothetical protein
MRGRQGKRRRLTFSFSDDNMFVVDAKHAARGAPQQDPAKQKLSCSLRAQEITITKTFAFAKFGCKRSDPRFIYQIAVQQPDSRNWGIRNELTCRRQ